MLKIFVCTDFIFLVVSWEAVWNLVSAHMFIAKSDIPYGGSYCSQDVGPHGIYLHVLANY